MREATDEMRTAEGQLARQDSDGAAQNAARAAEKLRQLERQGTATAQKRDSASGELRLEAQQIADEQRRIGAEANRLEKGCQRRERRCPARGWPARKTGWPIVSTIHPKAERLAAGEAKDLTRTGRLTSARCERQGPSRVKPCGGTRTERAEGRAAHAGQCENDA
jgi:hypothetical protein